MQTNGSGLEPQFRQFSFSVHFLLSKKKWRKKRTFRHPIVGNSNRKSSRFFFWFLCSRSCVVDSQNPKIEILRKKMQARTNTKSQRCRLKKWVSDQTLFFTFLACATTWWPTAKHQHYSAARHIYEVSGAKNRTKTNARLPKKKKKHLPPTRLNTTHQRL